MKLDMIKLVNDVYNTIITTKAIKPDNKEKIHCSAYHDEGVLVITQVGTGKQLLKLKITEYS